MKPHPDKSAAIRARDAVRHARGLVVLPSPGHVSEVLPSLEQALADLSSLAAAVRNGDPLDRTETLAALDQCGAELGTETLAALDQCGAELGRVRALLDHAAAWHTAWARILSGMAGTYGPGGAAPAVGERSSRLTVTV